MARSRVLLARLLDVLRRRTLERELDEELQTHIDMLVDEYTAGGLSREDASRAARVRLGGIEQTKEAVRDLRTVWFEPVWQDLRHAFRSLQRSPGFTIAALLTFALGIGASTAIFSVVYGVVLRQFPYRDAERLVLVQTRDRATRQVSPVGFSGPDLEDWRERTRTLQTVALCSRDTFALDADTGAESVKGAYVSRQFFEVLGVSAVLGHLPADADAPEIAISDRLWRTRFGADPKVVGRRVRVNGSAYSIVGVAGPGMTFPTESRSSLGAPATPPDLWAPVEGAPWFNRREFRVGQLVARMAPDRTIAQVSSDVDAVSRAFGRDYPDWSEYHEAVLVSLTDELTGAIRPALWLLLGAVGCVLLVACANVANLLLARQTSRTREIAMRVSLGAPRHRLLMHALSESLLLALVGGGLGVVMASWVVGALRWLEPADLPRLDSIRVDLPVLAFALGISTLSALISAVAPAWRLMTAGRAFAPGAEGRACTPGRNARRIRSALVIVELAVSLVLLVGATLLTRSFLRLVGTDIGVATDHVVTVELNLAMGRTLPPARQIQLAEQLVGDTSALPGVRAAAAANGLPPNRLRMMMSFNLPDWRTGRPVQRDIALLNPTPQYFRALGIPLVRGRLFTAADGADAPQIAIVNATAAKRLFGTAAMVGRTLPGSRKAGGKVHHHRRRCGGREDTPGSEKPSGKRSTSHFPSTRSATWCSRPGPRGDQYQLAGALAAVVHKVDRENLHRAGSDARRSSVGERSRTPEVPNGTVLNPRRARVDPGGRGSLRGRHLYGDRADSGDWRSDGAWRRAVASGWDDRARGALAGGCWRGSRRVRSLPAHALALGVSLWRDSSRHSVVLARSCRARSHHGGGHLPGRSTGHPGGIRSLRFARSDCRRPVSECRPDRVLLTHRLFDAQ